VTLSLKELEKQVKTMKNRVEVLSAQKAKHEKALASIDNELASLVGNSANGAPRKKRKVVKRKVAKKAKKKATKKAAKKKAKKKPGPKPGKKKAKTGKKAVVKKKAVKRTAKKKDGKPGLTDFVRSKVKGGPKSVDKLAKSAAKAGYKSGNLAQVIRLMVGKAADLNRSADDIIAAK
jgi:hypothetical protein